MRFTRIIFFLALLSACRSGESSYTVGAAGPWREGYGIMSRRGIDLAVDEINKRGGIKGTPLKVLPRDDEANGSRAATIAEELVANPAVLAVIGHVNSGAMLAASPIYDGQLVAVATTASSPDLIRVSRWTFRVISSDSLNGVILARFASRIGGTDAALKQAAILYENDSYGEDWLMHSVAHFAEQSSASTDQRKSECRALHRVSQDGRPGIVFVAGRETSALELLREAKRQAQSAACEQMTCASSKLLVGSRQLKGLVGELRTAAA